MSVKTSFSSGVDREPSGPAESSSQWPLYPEKDKVIRGGGGRSIAWNDLWVFWKVLTFQVSLYFVKQGNVYPLLNMLEGFKQIQTAGIVADDAQL